MHHSLLHRTSKMPLLLALFSLLSPIGFAQVNPKITIDLKSKGAQISEDLHGIFFEEISHGGEGGLYAELIQNRSFEESRIPEGCVLDSGWIIPPRTEHFGAHRVVDWKMPFEAKSDYPAWSMTSVGNAKANISLDLQNPLHVETPRSLKIDIVNADASNVVKIVNDGYWGIKVDQHATYRLTFYARPQGYRGDVTARLVSIDGQVLAEQKFHIRDVNEWQNFNGILKAKTSHQKAKFELVFSSVGKVWIDFVSLFPTKTFKDRANGMRLDLANYLAELKPAFLRWPGGCFVEGISVESAPNWKRSLGPVEKRSGTYSPWGYWSTDGIGYHEFLQFCEDINAKAMYVFNCGIACEMRSGVHVKDDGVPAIIADVLDAIEYAIGPKDSKWGSVRAANGHPDPFPLKYIEVGNEQVGVEYAKRFNVFYKAIKERYPQLEILAAMGIAHLNQPTIKAIDKMDFADEHAYKAAGWAMNYHDWYDKYERNDWKLYVGEYACNAGVGNGNMTAALNDATFILGMERNSDMIKMSSYAPLLENVNDTDWPVNLIRFDNARSFGRISYYAIKMLNENKASYNLSTTVDAPVTKDIPFFTGGIALSTWDTQAEFRDVEIIENGKVVFQSGNAGNNDWHFVGGKWSEENGVIAQRTEGAWPMAMLQRKTFSNYTLKLKARKISGYNAFMIPFAIKDNDNYLRVHIGAWVNKIAAFESVSKGGDAIVSQPVRLENPIEINRWYDVELRVANTSVECFLDGKLLMRYEKPRDFFAIAGVDEQSNEVVVKVVNASAQSRKVDLVLSGGTVNHKAKAITLSSPSADDENTFERPTQFIPVSESFDVKGQKSQYDFKPWSITILRMKK
ncbi:alpha-L-arabinofuranosidase C-terminal domain-containing protein [Pseudochryseolinea flava]|uniref:non-reducing end alpha-L-arabinofuranosidase n=1 Tax=Pseudochryseolinea flava TaxID=2059302 RepID=A0A364Y5L0_9BACT|nr:alpha-L-arabinofuranosidase C-terminal domain-containing protein [Pseudochryseolinea flava]RAW02278.1 alpha-L-arabinofuranosidase [Pseudochryseolinea flava]